MILRITGREPIAPHALRPRFDDGHATTIDPADMREGEIYGPLRDPLLFARVAVDREIGTIVWPNGVDFYPAILHDWPNHKDAFIAAAKRWRSQLPPE
jgi:Protein of unknown function (DUF2442)